MRTIPLQAIATRRKELMLSHSQTVPPLSGGVLVRNYELVEWVAQLGSQGRREEGECFASGFRATWTLSRVSGADAELTEQRLQLGPPGGENMGQQSKKHTQLGAEQRRE